AIAGMHYAGMKAAQFPMSTMVHQHGINGSWLAVLVSDVALSILGITLRVSMLDARQQARTALQATTLADANREHAQLALHDTLTRQPNRILLDDRLDQAISKADPEGTHFPLMFMEHDAFKALNDAYGHDVRDR
ncbi:diguanylate cyclase domain-containing protein, partial [Enterobacter sp. IF2SW-P2]|uniref:diguanylate cyclase domain-containing protein n=1 Tax=Enterobacter sp. IF2SW-P2 TaxID=1841144 RepID=UPI000B144B08